MRDGFAFIFHPPPPRLLYNLDAPTVRFDAVSLGAQNGDIAMIFFAYRFSVLSNGFLFSLPWVTAYRGTASIYSVDWVESIVHKWSVGYIYEHHEQLPVLVGLSLPFIFVYTSVCTCRLPSSDPLVQDFTSAR